MFQTELSVYFNGQDDDVQRVPLRRNRSDSGARLALVEPTKVIQLRDYQAAATENCLRDLEEHRSSLIVLATGLGKTILFCKLAQQWRGRILVLAHLEELLQNARDDLMAITGEPVGIERAKDHHEGERIVVGLIQSVSKRLKHFKPNHFSLIIIDEAHHAASEAYARVLEHFPSAKVVGLTATDTRSDGERLPFDVCSYRMGIREGIEQGYLVPINGKRVSIESIDLSLVKRKGDKEDGDFDESALDDEMVKHASFIADVLVKDYPWEKGILFFPGCASAKLTCELLNEREPESAIYIDGTITGAERRKLVTALRNGEARWLCNVGIATEGFNWPEASVVGMCSPTFSRPAYVQKVGRGTRPLAGLLNGLSTPGQRKTAIASSNKPSMLILDFVGASALGLVSHEDFLEEPKEKKPKVEEQEDTWLTDEDKAEPEVPEESFIDGPNINLRAIAKNVKSKSSHEYEEFNPFETREDEGGVPNLKGSTIGTVAPISHKQFKVLSRYGIGDESLTKEEAQKLIGFAASHGFRLYAPQLAAIKKLHRDIVATRFTAKEESWL